MYLLLLLVLLALLGSSPLLRLPALAPRFPCDPLRFRLHLDPGCVNRSRVFVQGPHWLLRSRPGMFEVRPVVFEVFVQGLHKSLH